MLSEIGKFVKSFLDRWFNPNATRAKYRSGHSALDDTDSNGHADLNSGPHIASHALDGESPYSQTNLDDEDPRDQDSGMETDGLAGGADIASRSPSPSLQSELDDLAGEALSLQGTNEALRNKAESLRLELEDSQRAHATAIQKLDLESAARAELSRRNHEVRERLAESRAKATERQKTLAESLKLTRDKLKSTAQLWNAAKKYFSLFRQGLLYDEIEKSDVNMAADTYLCLLPSTVPAALTLQHKYGGRVICDCVENVEVEKHSLAPNLQRTALEMVNLTAYGALNKSDGLMTVSNSVARTLKRFGPPVRVQPNYRRHEEPVGNGNIRERFGLPAGSTVLVTSGNVVEGFETVVDAIALLPDHVHLLALVKLSPASYAERAKAHIAERGMEGRIHLVGFVPYEELAGLLTDADLGIITLDPNNPNHSVSLPNRVFDFVTAGLPFIAPPLPDIRDFIEEHHCGAVLNEVSPEAWASTIESLLADLPRLRKAVTEARSVVTWESLDDGLIDFLGSPRTVTMLGFRDLSRYQRFLRTADSLSRRGIHVKAAFFSDNPQPVNIPNTEFYHFSERYGRGPGLVRVPNEIENPRDSGPPVIAP